MYYSPIKLALGGIVAWVIVWLLMPIDVLGHLAPGAMVYIVLCYVGLIIGVLFARGHKHQSASAPPPMKWNLPFDQRLFYVTALIGIFGMALRLFDRLVLRGAGYGANAVELREVLTEATVTPVGAIASLFFSFCLIPLILLLASNQARRWPLVAVAAVIFALPMTESLFWLARSFLVMTIGLGFAVVVITRYGGNPFDRRLILASVGGILALAVASTIIFSSRLEAGGYHLSDSIYDSVYAELLQPNDTAKRALNTGSGTQAFVYNAILPNGMYYLSGAYEMSVLWDRPDVQPWGYGQLHFLPFIRGFMLLTGTDYGDNFDIGDYLYRVGVWQTFFGPLWADFGWFGTIFMVIIGFLSERLANSVARGSIANLPLYCYVTVIIFFMPVVNFLMNGFGMFCIVSFGLFSIVVRGRTSWLTPRAQAALHPANPPPLRRPPERGAPGSSAANPL